MKIQQATLSDIQSLLNLLTYLFSKEEEFIPNQNNQIKSLKEIVNNPDIGIIFLAKKDNEIIGMVSLLYSISTALGGRVALLEDMVIKEEYQNQKVGSKLINYSLDYLKKSNVKRVTLLTDNNNFKAHDFYKKNGFKKSEMVAFRKIL